MYRKRFVCAAYVQMNITEDQMRRLRYIGEITMKKRNVNMYKGFVVMSVAMLCLMSCVGAVSVFAQEHEGHHGHGQGQGGGGRNWELMLGGGSFYKPEYSGSDEMKFKPVPLILAFYETNRFRLFVEGDKAGVGLKFGEQVPLSLSAGIGIGEGRDNDVVDLLQGTPTLENSVRLFGEAALGLPFVKVASTLNYFPITANYNETDRSDEDYNGLLVDVEVRKEWMRIPLMVMVGGGFSWMNSEYAEANYGVTYPTANLETFEAGSGMHSLNLSANIIMFFHEHVGTMLMAEGKQLLGDAADSPLTEQEFQTEIALMAFYRF